MKVSNIAYLSLSVFFLSLIQTPAKSVTIDLFNDVDGTGTRQNASDDTNDGLSATNPDGLTTPLSNVLGGIRRITVEKLTGSPDDDGVTKALLQVKTDESLIALSSDNSVQPGFSVLWDGDFDDSGSNNYLDLTENGDKNAFQINVTRNDLGLKLNFDVTKANNTVASYTSPQIAAGTTGNLTFPFASFSNSSAFQEAKSIRMYSSNEAEDLDFSFTLFQTTKIIPFEFSPSLGIIIGGGFLGLHTLRKKIKAGTLSQKL
jgi:hypothetical protein